MSGPGRMTDDAVALNCYYGHAGGWHSFAERATFRSSTFIRAITAASRARG